MSTYTNVAGSNIKKILNLKENFPNLLVEKIEEIYKTVKNSGKSKLKICIMTKGLLYHQIIILMNSETVSKVLVKSSKHVANINSLLKNINSNTIVDFIRVDSKDITITTNNVTAQSNLLTIEKYIKEINSIQSEDILTICLPQSKSYLKILGILYINKTNGTSIKLGDMENIIKTTHVFNNITLASKPHIIKTSSKSDIAVVQINVQDVQSGANAKTLINKSFNVGKHITIIQGININSNILQCKNYWRWGYTTFACHAHRAKCPKYNGLYKLKYYCDMMQCCMLQT